MARIAIIHNKFDTKGGAESVCFNTIEAIQTQHDVKLFTFEKPNFHQFNSYFNTSVNPIPVWETKLVGPLFNATVAQFNALSNGRFGSHIKLKTGILKRLVSRKTKDYDLTISTANEMALPNPSIQYIHFPLFNARFDEEYGVSGPVSIGYDWLTSTIAGANSENLRQNTLLANSDWTAEVVNRRYNIKPKVVYPPVNVEEFHGEPWEDREDGFVSIGRISPDKRTLRIIKIIAGIRRRGHEVHLHIIGSFAKRNEEYADRVRRTAATKDWISVEGETTREELVEICGTHKYGIHGKPLEHFGISIAELVAAGTLPFVPDDGGQVELVGNQQELLFGSTEEAIEIIDEAISNHTTKKLRSRLPSISKFSQGEFQDKIRRIVKENV